MSEQYCSVSELRSKEVVNILDGYRLGLVHDVNFDLDQGCAVSLIILGERKFFGLFGREEDYIIAWKEIKRIGADVVLVEVTDNNYIRSKHKKGRFYKNTL